MFLFSPSNLSLQVKVKIVVVVGHCWQWQSKNCRWSLDAASEVDSRKVQEALKGYDQSESPHWSSLCDREKELIVLVDFVKPLTPGGQEEVLDVYLF